ncbi:hypothetical protein ABHQ57_13260 [Tenacibaculum sp. ZH5_bin.1]|uniref:hypothetical protein n=1 Tax=unclassified Tenacibaculum TaxID=2635139 RepID=UPI0036E8BBCB
MRFYYLLLIALILNSCSSRIERPEIKGTLYDSLTYKPVKGVLIQIDDEQIKSDNQGKFTIQRVKKRVMFNFEGGHVPLFYSMELKHPKYKSIKIEKGTRGSFGEETILYDSIFLKPLEK